MWEILERYPDRYRAVFLVPDGKGSYYVNAKTFDSIDEAKAYNVDNGNFIDIIRVSGKRVRNQIGAVMNHYTYAYFDIHTYDVEDETMREYHIRRDHPAFYTRVQSKDLELALFYIDCYRSNVRLRLDLMA